MYNIYIFSLMYKIHFLMFAMYISLISNVVTAHSLDHHQYSDDTQL